MLLLGVKLVSCSDAVVNSIRPLIPGANLLPVIANGCDVAGNCKARSFFSFFLQFCWQIQGQDGCQARSDQGTRLC